MTEEELNSRVYSRLLTRYFMYYFTYFNKIELCKLVAWYIDSLSRSYSGHIFFARWNYYEYFPLCCDWNFCSLFIRKRELLHYSKSSNFIFAVLKLCWNHTEDFTEDKSSATEWPLSSSFLTGCYYEQKLICKNIVFT